MHDSVHHIHRQVDGDVVEDDDMQFVYSNQSTTHLAVYTSPTCGFTEGTTAIYCIQSALSLYVCMYVCVCVCVCV